MKFRRNRTPASSAETVKPEQEFQELASGPGGSARGRWSTGFLMVGSALVGATALALWNRRTIATMRAQIQATSERAVPSISADEEIF